MRLHNNESLYGCARKRMSSTGIYLKDFMNEFCYKYNQKLNYAT